MVQKCAWRCWVCASRCTGGKARSRIGKTETARPTVTRTAPGSPVFTNGFERTEDRRGEHDQHHQSYPRICIERPRGVLVGVEESDLEQQDTGAVAHASPAPGALSMLEMLRLLAGLISGVSAASWPTRAAARCADPTSPHTATRGSAAFCKCGARSAGPTSLTLPATPIPDYSRSHARLAVSKLVMDMSKRDERTSDRELRPIGWVRAHALMIWGPAQSWDNPLMGTRYDPVLRQDQLRARHARREARREGREQRRLDRARIGDEHCTPDE